MIETKRLVAALAMSLSTLAVHAVDIAISAQDTYVAVQKADSKVLFVDVRDPVEVMFIGFTDTVHINIPFLMVDRSGWEDKRNIYRLYQNPDFVTQIKAALDKRGLAADAEIITMCRSGSERGEPSATFLRANGFPNARYVVNGFQGGAVKEGPKAGFRLQNGWMNSELPWSMKMNPAKMYRTDVH